MNLALAASLAAALGAAAAQPAPVQSSYPVTLTYQEWAQVVGAVRRSDTLSAHRADDIVNKIAQQVADDQKQGAASAPAKK
jgi:hypothetical protein